MAAIASFDSGFSTNKIPFFSYKNFSANFIKYEYPISGVATAIFSSGMVVATGGSISIAFFGVRIIQGAVICFLNHHLSNLGITIIKNSIGKIYSFFDDSVESIVSFKATVDTIRSSTYFKTIRTSVNIFMTIMAFTVATGSDSLYLMNLVVSLSNLAYGAFLLKAKRVSENLLTSYSYIKKRELRKQIELVFQPRFNFNFPAFLRALLGNIPGKVDVNFLKVLNQYFSEKKQVGRSSELIKKAIVSYKSSLGQYSREREAFENEYACMHANAFKEIAIETVSQILSLPYSYGIFSCPYPSIILKEYKQEFEVIHKKFYYLPKNLQVEVQKRLHCDEGPQDLVAKEVWCEIRDFSYKKMVHSNPIFEAAIQDIFSPSGTSF